MADETPGAVERSVDRDLEAAGAAGETEIVKRESGVRMRTNIQAGGASERVNVTSELHAEDMPDLIHNLESYRAAMSEQLEWARSEAQRANE